MAWNKVPWNKVHKSTVALAVNKQEYAIIFQIAVSEFFGLDDSDIPRLKKTLNSGSGSCEGGSEGWNG